VEEAIRTAFGEKRGPYGQYSVTVRAEIGKYACHHGVAAAVQYFSRKRDKTLNENTVKRMKFVKRKATTAKSKQTAANFAKLKQSFLEEVVTAVEVEEIPPDLIMNWHQTGIEIVSCSTWTMERQSSKRV